MDGMEKGLPGLLGRPFLFVYRNGLIHAHESKWKRLDSVLVNRELGRNSNLSWRYNRVPGLVQRAEKPTERGVFNFLFAETSQIIVTFLGDGRHVVFHNVIVRVIQQLASNALGFVLEFPGEFLIHAGTCLCFGFSFLFFTGVTGFYSLEHFHREIIPGLVIGSGDENHLNPPGPWHGDVLEPKG